MLHLEVCAVCVDVKHKINNLDVTRVVDNGFPKEQDEVDSKKGM